MKSRAFMIILGMTAALLADACTSTDKNVTPTDGGTASDASNDSLMAAHPPALESKPRDAAPHARATHVPPTPAPRPGRNKHDESPPSSAGDGTHDTADKVDPREARVTPLDQSDAPNDLDITRRIRQAVIRDDSLSFRAKNVTIVTNGDRVVLTGRVNTRAEADRIKDIAQSVAPYRIEDRLEIRQ
jgi:hypothetical protein